MDDLWNGARLPPGQSNNADSTQGVIIDALPISEDTRSMRPVPINRSLPAQLYRLIEVLFIKARIGWVVIAASIFGAKMVFGAKPFFPEYGQYLMWYVYVLWVVGWSAWVNYGLLLNSDSSEYYTHRGPLAVIVAVVVAGIFAAPVLLGLDMVVVPLGWILLWGVVQIALLSLPNFDESGPAFLREVYVFGLIVLAFAMRIVGQGWW